MCTMEYKLEIKLVIKYASETVCESIFTPNDPKVLFYYHIYIFYTFSLESWMSIADCLVCL